MATLTNAWKVIARESGEIRDWLRPGAAKVAGLLLAAVVIVGTTITLAFPFLAHPQGWAGYMTHLLQSFCAPDSACNFQQIYPSFSLFVLVLSTTTTFLGIILHMYAHRWDPDMDEMDTYIKAMDSRLDDIEELIRKDIDLDTQAISTRLDENGKR